ncbi:hypothetical protein IMSHALPRED_003480 [Imshaugia aleurites]|uniref:Fe2OG dioxygenase domain-containing protein n=1 Tax=Imshaugia aleurites TaxID=172621 RepID=A0A8H3F2U2_9LECA|nr:hypothetical protein IMSHALPRED_003480 [Imshaugia aleurites]
MELLERAFDMSKKLFDLPLEDKLKAPHPKIMTPHRGYSGVRDLETIKSLKRISDYKESYEIGSDENREHYNIWLPEQVLPGFRDFTTQLYWKLSDVATAILEALILSVGFSEEEAKYVRKLHNGHTNQLRLLHYPTMPHDFPQYEDQSRLGAHTDWESFTFLFQDSHQGLEFLDRETGEFVAATPKPDTLYMNIGEMFMRLSNGYYPAGIHRVVIPASYRSSRYSIPFFVSPDPDAVIVPQPSCVAAGQKRRYEPITYRGFLNAQFKRIHVQKNPNRSQ